MISRRLFASGFLVAAVAPAFGHPHQQLDAERRGDIEQQITAFRGALKDAVAAKDITKLRAMFAESFTHTEPSGRVEARDAHIASLLSGEPALETAVVSQITVSLHGPDMAVVVGRSALPQKGGGSADMRWMQAYARAAGDWQLAASQATRISATS